MFSIFDFLNEHLQKSNKPQTHTISFLINYHSLVNCKGPAISHINYWDQVYSWKNLWEFWNGPLCRNKSGPFPLLNVAVYWQSSDTETCAKKLSQILANNIDNGGRGIGLRIYVRYCGFRTHSSKSCKAFPKNIAFDCL